MKTLLVIAFISYNFLAVWAILQKCCRYKGMENCCDECTWPSGIGMIVIEIIVPLIVLCLKYLP